MAGAVFVAPALAGVGRPEDDGEGAGGGGEARRVGVAGGFGSGRAAAAGAGLTAGSGGTSTRAAVTAATLRVGPAAGAATWLPTTTTGPEDAPASAAAGSGAAWAPAAAEVHNSTAATPATSNPMRVSWCRSVAAGVRLGEVTRGTHFGSGTGGGPARRGGSLHDGAHVATRPTPVTSRSPPTVATISFPVGPDPAR